MQRGDGIDLGWAPVSTALLLAALLAGCGSGLWTKKGVSPETTARELSECRHEADQALSKDIDIDQDILSTRGQDWSRTGVLSTKRTNMEAQNEGRQDDLVDACMTAKGYAHAS